jgi:hypothetical protein
MTPETLVTATRDRVAQILRDRFPAAEDFGDGSYALSHGSSSVIIVVRPYTETDTMVEVMAQVVTSATMSADVMHFLLRKNAELHFGAFSLLFDDTIMYSYSVAGSTLDANELEAAVTSVAVIADHYDDEIVAMAGGKRAADVE